MSAQTLKQSDFERLRRRIHVEGGQLTLEEKFNYWRTALEVFYRETASSSLLLADNRGRSRDRIRLYEVLKEGAQKDGPSDEIVLPYDRKLHKQTHLSVLPDRHARILLLHELLQTTPIYQNGKFLPGIEYCHNDLARFAKQAVRMKRYLEGQLGISVRHDVEKKPVQFLGGLLSMVEVAKIPTRQETVGNDNKIRYYMISATSLQLLDNVCKRRAEIDGWKFVREQYGFEDSLDDIEYLAA